MRVHGLVSKIYHRSSRDEDATKQGHKQGKNVDSPQNQCDVVALDQVVDRRVGLKHNVNTSDDTREESPESNIVRLDGVLDRGQKNRLQVNETL